MNPVRYWTCPRCSVLWDKKIDAETCCDRGLLFRLAHQRTPVKRKLVDRVYLCSACLGGYRDRDEASQCCPNGRSLVGVWMDIETYPPPAEVLAVLSDLKSRLDRGIYDRFFRSSRFNGIPVPNTKSALRVRLNASKGRYEWRRVKGLL